jgi:hypothetical protein
VLKLTVEAIVYCIACMSIIVLKVNKFINSLYGKKRRRKNYVKEGQMKGLILV